MLARIAFVAAVAWASAVSADDKGTCFYGADAEARMQACSAMLDRNPNDALVYHHRGLAVQATGDVERAIADYTKAIVLKPNYGPVYESRARAYAARGDYTNAVADITRATELTPKPVIRKPAAAPVKPAVRPQSKVKVAAKARPRPKAAPSFEQMLLQPRPDWAPGG